MQAIPSQQLGNLLHKFQHDKSLFIGLRIIGWICVVACCAAVCGAILAFVGVNVIPFEGRENWVSGALLLLIALVPFFGGFIGLAMSNPKEVVQVNYYERGLRILAPGVDKIATWREIQTIEKTKVTDGVDIDPFSIAAKSLMPKVIWIKLLFHEGSPIGFSNLQIKRFGDLSRLLKSLASSENISWTTRTVTVLELQNYLDSY